MRSPSGDDLRPDGSLDSWLAAIVQEKLDSLLSFLADRDRLFEMERIHKCRVTARRLEAVLRVFEHRFPQKKSREARDNLRQLIRLFGKVRERDVFLDQMRKKAVRLRGQDRIVMNLLLAREFRKQQKATGRLDTYLAVFRAKRFRRLVEDLVAAIDRKEKLAALPRLKEPPFTISMRRTILRLLSRFLEFEKRVVDHPERLTEFHEMRLAGKPLRYMVENALPAAGIKAKHCLREIESLLDEMGTIHDDDVAVGILSRYVDEIADYDPSLRRTARLLGGLREEQQRGRERLFRSVCRRLKRWERDDMRLKIGNALA